ncbi:MAG TPA: hypothetical protein VJN88_16145 [Ktedonobacterales bacterium]|nr:hypothetical protein [Ktedonobacterales bacterium]
MPVTTQQFEQIATTVTERASSVLRASVWVVDERGAMLRRARNHAAPTAI